MTNLVQVAVIIPALNEEGNIAVLVAEIQAAAETLQLVEISGIYVVDNGSTDATAAVAREAGAIVVSEPVPGYGRACFQGVLAAVDAEILMFMDGDRSEVPAEMERVLAPLLADTTDLVLGSRVRGDLEDGALTPAQRWGNRVASWFLLLGYRVRITDLGPFRAISRQHLLDLGMQEMTYGWPTEMIARAAEAGLRIEEVPVSCRRRRAGVSKVSGSFRASVLTGWRIANVIFSVRRADVPNAKGAR